MTLLKRLCLQGLISLCMVALVVARNGTVAKVYPVDEADRDPSFAAYRGRLLHAAKHNDLNGVLAMVSPDVKGDEDLVISGLAGLKAEWTLDDDPRRFLALLIDILQLGGRFNERGQFVASYVFTDFPGDYEDMPRHVVVIHDNVPIYAKASRSGMVIAHASYDVLPAVTGPLRWFKIRLSDGRTGYIRETDARQPGPRAYFEKIDGDWKLTVLAPGID